MSPLRPFGRLLQWVGLLIPPLAIMSQLSGSISQGQMLTFLVAAVCAFWLGRMLEGIGQG